MQHGKLRTDRSPCFIGWLFQLSYTYISGIPPQEAVIPTLRPASTQSQSTSSGAWGDESPEPTEIKNPIKNEDNEKVPGNPLRDLPEWLEEFTENLDIKAIGCVIQDVQPPKSK